MMFTEQENVISAQSTEYTLILLQYIYIHVYRLCVANVSNRYSHYGFRPSKEESNIQKIWYKIKRENFGFRIYIYIGSAQSARFAYIRSLIRTE